MSASLDTAKRNNDDLLVHSNRDGGNWHPQWLRGANVNFEVRLMKNVVAFPDAPVANAWKTLQNTGSARSPTNRSGNG